MILLFKSSNMYAICVEKLNFLMILYFMTTTVLRARAQLPTLEEAPRDATGYQGASVTFDCTVRHLGGYNVLWLKRKGQDTTYISRNWDLFPYINSSKYLIQNDEYEPSFRLEIFDLQMEDEGAYECRYESQTVNEFLGSATLAVVPVVPIPTCEYVTVPSSNEIIYDLNCVWSSNSSDPPVEILKNGKVLPIDFLLSDRVISRQKLDNSDQLNDFECRRTSPTTGQMNSCRYQLNTHAPIALGVEPYVNDVVVGQTARFECQAEMVSSLSEITYSWSITRNGEVVDLGERQKGLMKQSMRILGVELADDGINVMCTARSSGGVVYGGGSLAVYLPTSMAPTQWTSRPVTVVTSQVGSTLLPKIKEQLMDPTIISIIAVLLLFILILLVVIIYLARSKTRREKWIAMGRNMSFKKSRVKRNPRQDKTFLEENREIAYPDPNPDIIQAHSTQLPIYAMPDKSWKSNTIGPRQPPRHYTPRRQSYSGVESKETQFIDQKSDLKPSDEYGNPYEDIDDETVKDVKRMRAKSHTVSHFYQTSNPSSIPGSPRRYRGMKSAGSSSMLYAKPEKPPRNPKGLSLKSRKSWDQPGSIENLCNYAMSDTRSAKSFTGSICDGDNYACVDDGEEGNTMMSDYMDMNPVLDDSTLDDLHNITRESEVSGYDEPPLYADIN